MVSIGALFLQRFQRVDGGIQVLLRHQVRIEVIVHNGIILIGAGHGADAVFAAAALGKAAYIRPDAGCFAQNLGCFVGKVVNVVGDSNIELERIGHIRIDVVLRRTQREVGRCFLTIDRAPRIQCTDGMPQYTGTVARFIQGAVAVVQQTACKLRLSIDKDRQNIHFGVPEVVTLIPFAGQAFGTHTRSAITARCLHDMIQVEAQPLLQRHIAVHANIGSLPEMFHHGSVGGKLLIISVSGKGSQFLIHKREHGVLVHIEGVGVDGQLFQCDRVTLLGGKIVFDPSIDIVCLMPGRSCCLREQMHRAAGHRQLAVDSGALAGHSFVIGGQCIGQQMTPKRTVVHQRICGTSMVFHIGVQCAVQRQRTAEVHGGNAVALCHAVFVCKADKADIFHPDSFTVGGGPFKAAHDLTVLHIQCAAVILQCAGTDVHRLTVHHKTNRLAVRHIQDRLALGREAEVPLAVADVLLLVQPIEEIALQAVLLVKIVGFLMGAAGADIAVGKRKRRFVAVVHRKIKVILRYIPRLKGINWGLVGIHCKFSLQVYFPEYLVCFYKRIQKIHGIRL